MIYKKGLRKIKPINLFAIIISLFIAFSLAGCSSLEEAMEKAKANIPGDWQLIYTDQINDSTAVVFYTKDNELGSALFQKDSLGWNWIGSGLGKLVTYPNGLAWRYSELGKDRIIPVFYGIINNPDITKIQVHTTYDQTVTAKIVSSDAIKLWYAYVDKPQSPSINADIIGFNKDGKVIYLFSKPKQGSK